MHRTRNNALEAPTKGNDNEKSIYKHDEGKSKKGIRKRIEVVISKLRHQACRTKIRKGVHVLFAASIIASAIILLLNMFSLPYHRSRRIPRNMVQLVGEKDYVRLQFLSQMKLEPLINYRPERIKHKHGHESFENGNCKAMHQWQVEAYPTCNKLHEIDPNNLNLVASGGFRDVFAMKDWNGTTVAVKTLLDGSSYSYRHYDRHRRDAVAMSLLTSSKHIPNIYGYCINSGMFDFTPDGSLDDHIYSEEKWTKQQKLRFSWQATTALADVHGIGMRKDSASISHTDISADQFLWLDGMYKVLFCNLRICLSVSLTIYVTVINHIASVSYRHYITSSTTLTALVLFDGMFLKMSRVLSLSRTTQVGTDPRKSTNTIDLQKKLMCTLLAMYCIKY